MTTGSFPSFWADARATQLSTAASPSSSRRRWRRAGMAGCPCGGGLLGGMETRRGAVKELSDLCHTEAATAVFKCSYDKGCKYVGR